MQEILRRFTIADLMCNYWRRDLKGGVGSGVASCRARIDNRIKIIARDAMVARLGQEGLIRMGIFGCVYARPDTFGSYASRDHVDGGLYDTVLTRLLTDLALALV